MNALLRSLAEVCRTRPLGEKIFIVPSYRIGHQLCEALVLSGTNYANLRVETLFGLALGAVNLKLSANGITLLSEGTRLSIVEELFRREIYQKKGLYFGDLEPGVGIVSALSRALEELRLAGVQQHALKASQFVSKEKFEAILLLMNRFEVHLAKTKTIDQAGVYRLAVDALPEQPSPNTLYVVHPRLSLQELPHRFLQKLTGAKSVVLESDPLHAITPTRQFSLWKTTTSPGESRFSWIAVPQTCPKSIIEGPVDFFHAIGAVNEVKEVLRRVTYDRLPLDSVEVACTDYSTYASLFFLEQQRQGLNITYGDGIPSSHTDAGKALLGFVDWIETDYSVTELRYLVSANVLVRKELQGIPPIGSQEIVRALRRAKIGWGKERYALLLDSLVRDDEERSRTPQPPGDDTERTAEWYAERAKRTKWVLEFTKGLLACSPEASDPENIDVRKFADGLITFLKDYCSRADELNRASYSALTDMLQDLASSASGTESITSLCEKVRVRLQELRVGGSSSKPGHLHVSSFSRAGATARANNFVVGLQEHAFPGSQMEDPILLDAERRKLSDRLLLSTDRFDEKLLSMYAYLAGIRGKLTLSFPSYSVEEGREVAPSPLVLKAYRLVSNNPEADFSAVRQALGDPVSYISDRPANENEWWLGRLIPQGARTKARKKVLERFSHLSQGLDAVHARESDDFTEYDGNVGISAAIDDPRKNRGMVLSASRIETLAGCPFGYFVKYVLGLEPPEDIEYDASVWLDAAGRGSLLHAIYENFMREVTAKGEKVLAKKHRPVLMKIGEKHIQAKKAEIPPPSDRVYEGERQEILASLDIFLRMEEDLSSEGTPRFFELRFGVGNGKKGTVGRSEPVKINIGKDTFLLRGFIDRVDELREHEFRVLDYKTGGTFGFSSNGYFESGKKIQHCLYARAAEAILREQVDKAARVVQGSYYFPTRKGEAQHFVKVQNRSRELDSLLQTLFDVIAKGAFLPRKDQCFLCRDYDLCSITRENVAAKLEKVTNNTLEPIRKLEEYD